ncbi:hypothetical protein [uncultured Erythrobacter sp.]|uniref:hypothetical protein n=1 Tax=uncultured Erythrobacter sp. TaxID=263913 RepID=UPI0026295070|nr:hypothetical protein [uncultured Erythrobacter sp.]
MSRFFEDRSAINGQEFDLWTRRDGEAKMGRAILTPMLALLPDPDDPSSVIEIDPDGDSDQLGDGVFVRRISVALTDKDISFTLLERYPWILDYKNKYLDGSKRSSVDLLGGPPAWLIGPHFSTGVLK